MSDKYILLEFSGTWCIPCQRMIPLVHEVIQNIENIELIHVDVDKEPNVIREYKIRSIPTLVLLKDGEVIKTLIGSKNKNEIKDFLKISEVE